MADPIKALATQLANIETRTGKSLAQLVKLARASGLEKHGELRDRLKQDLGIGYGDANTLAHHVLDSGGPGSASPAAPSIDESVASYYSGPKAALRPIHEKLMAAIGKFGTFKIAPKKSYVSLRRKKQFAMIGPATNTAVEVGLNTTALSAGGRLVAFPPGGMCNFKVRLAGPAEVDAELLGWIRKAFDGAG
ncbi:MAG: DUF5655 domain-containing protein [Betaproteobacteria bacterium]